FFFCNATPTTEIYTLSLHDALPILQADFDKAAAYHENIARSLKELGRMKKVKEKHDRDWLKYKQIEADRQQKELLYKVPVNIYEDRKSTRLNSSHVKISYAVFCLKK